MRHVDYDALQPVRCLQSPRCLDMLCHSAFMVQHRMLQHGAMALHLKRDVAQLATA